MSIIVDGDTRRLLLLDRNPLLPRYFIATVSLPTDVHGADLDNAGKYTDWPSVTAWVTAQVGPRAALAPVHDALVWVIGQAAAGANPR
jgi:hypothetical protein